VFGARGERVFRVTQGDRLASGDRLKFEVSAPGAGWLAVFSVEEGGRVTSFAPASGGPALRVASGTTIVPGAIALDGHLGREWLVAVFAPEPFVSAEAARYAGALVAGAGRPPTSPGLPRGWSSFVFAFAKVSSEEKP
jgi:hypothetical protein